MRWRDAIVLARRSVSRRPGRAALTVLAVALAAALFTALLTISRTAETRVLNGLAKGGPLSGIRVTPSVADPGEADQDNAKGQGRMDLTGDNIARIRKLAHVRSVIPILGTSVALSREDPLVPLSTATGHRADRRGEPIERASVVGFDIRRAASLPVTVEAGRLPAPRSVNEIALTPSMLSRLGMDPKNPLKAVGMRLSIGSFRVISYLVSVPYPTDQPCVDCQFSNVTLDLAPAQADSQLSARLAQDVGLLSPRQGSSAASQSSAATVSPPGYVFDRSQLTSRWTKIVVVGVVAQEAAPGDALASAELVGRANDWSVSYGDRPAASPYRGLFVEASDMDHVGDVRAAISKIGYSSSAPENLIASVRRYLHVVEIVLGGIAAIALLIASLGICNALLAAIRERRREIGVLKAIGARDRDVRRIFLIEASVLGLAGGVLGTAIGLGCAAVVGAFVNTYLAREGLAGVSLTVSLSLVLAAVVGSTLLATAAGVVPALRGARLPAREAVDA